MAETPEPPKNATKPAPTRRRAPRKASATKAPAAKTPARKPAVAKSAAAASAPAAPKRAAPALKPRAASRPTPAPKRRAPATQPAAKSTIEQATEKVGGKWGAAAVIGGIAAVGAAATAALLSLRGSTPKTEPEADPKPEGGAHAPDGKDASKSFKAGIADGNSIPD